MKFSKFSQSLAFENFTEIFGQDREDVGEDVGVVECGLYAIVCVGETSDIVGVTSVGETLSLIHI